MRHLLLLLPFLIAACQSTITTADGGGGLGGEASGGDAGAEAGDAGAEAGDDCACWMPASGACPCTAEGAARLACGQNWIPVCCGGGTACDLPPAAGPITCEAAPGSLSVGWCCSGPASCP